MLDYFMRYQATTDVQQLSWKYLNYTQNSYWNITFGLKDDWIFQLLTITFYLTVILTLQPISHDFVGFTGI